MEIDPNALEAARETFSSVALTDCETPLGAAIAAYLRAREAQGFVEVPVEPTREMIEAGFYPATQKRGAKSVWGCMLAARPQKETE